MADTEQPREDIAAPSGNPESAPAEPAGGDEFDHVLGEFDAATKPANGYFEPSPENVDRLLRDDAPTADALREGNGTDARAHALEQAVHQMREQEALRVEREDLHAFFREGQSYVRDLPVPENFAETYLIARAMKDDELAWCWDHRNDPSLDPRTKGRITGKLKTVLRDVREEAKSFPDRDATEDHAAVRAWMMQGGRGKFDGAEPPLNYGAMSDSLFRKTVRERHGFDPGI